jgi:hypothetical protein
MGIDRTFVKHGLLAIALIGAAGAYPLLVSASRDIIIAVLIGFGMSVVNAVAGVLTVEFAFGKPQATFLKAVLGGMGIRMAALLGLLYLLIAVFRVHVVGLTATLLGFYALFLVLEILSIQRKIESES